MRSAKSLDSQRKLKNSTFDIVFRIAIVYPVIAWCLYTIVVLIVFHSAVYVPSAWQLFGLFGLVGGLQEKRWHNTFGYITVCILMLLGIAFGVWVDGGFLAGQPSS